MEMLLSVRRGPVRKRWERTAVVLLVLAVVVLLAAVFAPQPSSPRLAFLVPATVLIALSTVFGFQAQFMLQANREQLRPVVSLTQPSVRSSRFLIMPSTEF